MPNKKTNSWKDAVVPTSDKKELLINERKESIKEWFRRFMSPGSKRHCYHCPFQKECLDLGYMFDLCVIITGEKRNFSGTIPSSTIY